jgi:hypothetical protein
VMRNLLDILLQYLSLPFDIDIFYFGLQWFHSVMGIFRSLHLYQVSLPVSFLLAYLGLSIVYLSSLLRNLLSEFIHFATLESKSRFIKPRKLAIFAVYESSRDHLSRKPIDFGRRQRLRVKKIQKQT